VLRLSEDEVWSRLAAAHTGIVTTLRRDGMPISLPVWFVTDGRTVVFSSPAGSKKVARLERDPRAGFLVESGKRWSELSAVHLTGTVEVIEAEGEATRLEALVNAKYEAFRDLGAMSGKARTGYAAKRYFRLRPDERVLSWDNSRIARGDA
jgi:PPOX class probable F420-dependent enzyme